MSVVSAMVVLCFALGGCALSREWSCTQQAKPTWDALVRQLADWNGGVAPERRWYNDCDDGGFLFLHVKPTDRLVSTVVSNCEEERPCLLDGVHFQFWIDRHPDEVFNLQFLVSNEG